MRISGPAAYALCVVMAALLGGCSGSLNPAASSSNASVIARGALQPSDTFAGLKWTGDVHPDHQKSWISPDVVNTKRVLFVSDAGTNDVYMFGLPDMKLEGTLTGFNQPQGECSDKHGHVYIANTKSSQVLEYSHTGTLLNTYADTYGYPMGCAINPINGNLAVTNLKGFTGAGQVLIYASPTAVPTVLSNPSQHYYYFDGYSPYGELFVDGKNSKGAYMVSDCGASGPTCSTIKLRFGRIHSPGAVQFDRFEQAWVLFDQGPCASGGSCSYWVYAHENYKLSEPNIYETYKGGPVCDLIQGVIKDTGNEIVGGGDDETACGNASTSANNWPYTAELNESPTNYNVKYVSHPVGAAISETSGSRKKHHD